MIRPSVRTEAPEGDSSCGCACGRFCLVAEQLAPVVDDLEAVFDIEVCYNDPGVGRFGLENALLPIGNQLLEVVAPVEENTAGGRYLEKRRRRRRLPCSSPSADDHAPRRRRVEELGIRLVNDFERHGFQNMQLHPKDTGGTFFEIDCQTNGLEPDGPWEPAGDNWQRCRRTDVIDAIVAGEIQTPDPARLAARWSEIAEIPLDDVGGVPTIPFENADLRFVLPSDGRPEGLGGIDVRRGGRGPRPVQPRATGDASATTA